MLSAFSEKEKYASISGQYQFFTPTADTRKMILATREVLDRIFKEDVRYAKAGVILGGIYQYDEIQLDIFADHSAAKVHGADEEYSISSNDKLMTVIDELNRRYKPHKHQYSTIFIASEGINSNQAWQMNREFLSPCYTTRITDLIVVK